MLKKFSKKISMVLVCSSLLVFTSAPAFASTTGATSVKALSTVATQVGTSDVFELNFVSNQLTKTGDTTATFKYKILDETTGADITQTMPASQLYGVATVSSTVSFDPLTGTGTITFESSYDTDKSIIVTLLDVISGKVTTSTMHFNTVAEKKQ